MFKTADPTRRVPTYLQARTKENFIWQLKLTGLILVGMWAKDYLEHRRELQKRTDAH